MKLGIGALSFGPKATVNLPLIQRAEELGHQNVAALLRDRAA